MHRTRSFWNSITFSTVMSSDSGSECASCLTFHNVNNTPTCHEQFNLTMGQSFTDLDSIVSIGKRHLKSSSSHAVGDCSASFLSRGVTISSNSHPSQAENEDSYGEFEQRLAEQENQVLHLVEIFTLRQNQKQLRDPELEICLQKSVPQTKLKYFNSGAGNVGPECFSPTWVIGIAEELESPEHIGGD